MATLPVAVETDILASPSEYNGCGTGNSSSHPSLNLLFVKVMARSW
eukprot:CAMPEP_0197672490 /NCGR_PEP_ID=MMETSP1338-20131121/79065_1 /TAXON_ID=43686 ORGANISM="Pelagodinium beii, Strain RCC1491" /NCGR_SAMPLE_ID=MMETSP1338 /ASSEMBLY_ACC=CAM_ASM_000754 /LENGTH=45 /DNA_ID= /DNA_START= /DNA_END= /DNA_ORIENTATION=